MVKLITTQFTARLCRLGLGCFIVIMTTSIQGVAATSGLVDPMQSMMDVADDSAASGGELVLQSVLISSGRKLALISGVTYQVGDKVGDATLVKVKEHHVVLKNADNTLQTLNMYQGIEKKLVAQEKKSSKGQQKLKQAVKKTGSNQ